MSDPYYRSKGWLQLRAVRLRQLDCRKGRVVKIIGEFRAITLSS
jgi:hypothetical protein